MAGYSDADYADKSTPRRWVSRTVVSPGGADISWSSTTQRCVTSSTTATKNVDLGGGVKEALFTGAVLSVCLLELCKCYRGFEENQGGIALAANPLGSARSRHTNVRLHVVRELLRTKKIEIQFVASEKHAETLTKSLPATSL